ncbi:hypothetical protein DFH09DRAFT_1361261 [Mycena vulgaris]|nr:hypothetical protein DFH09DRAFT_1361261 [Mycena vulgaris]
MSGTKFKTPTCLLCRQKKLRCGGEHPCGPCTRARTLVVCTYDYTPKIVGRQGRSELPKGGACLPCRQRKRRCDGNLPCRTCQASTPPRDCQYRGTAHKGTAKSADHSWQSSADASTSSFRSTPPPSTVGDPAPFELAPDSTDEIATMIDLYLPVPRLFDPSPSESLARPGFPNLMGPSEYPVATGSPGSDALPLSTLPDLSHSYLVSPARVDILDNGGIGKTTLATARLQHPLQSGLATELFAVRNLFLDHSWHYGLDITTEKRDAISRGDKSGAIVHPMLVNVSQLVGYLIASHSQSETWVYLQDPTFGEAMHASRIFNILYSSADALDPVTTIQVYSLFALYYAAKGNVAMFAQLFDRLGGLVVRNLAVLGFEDILTLKPLSESSLDLSPSPTPEVRSAFSGMMWLELGRSVVLKLPPILDPLILIKFRQLAATHQTATEINFIRAKSALFLFDSRQLSVESARWESGHPPLPEWSQRCWTLTQDIYAHLSVINKPGLEVSFIHNAQVITLKNCIIMALAALAELYALRAPFNSESRREHGEVIEEIAAITSVFSVRDFQYMDATMGACWAIALRSIPDIGASKKRDEPGGVRPHGLALDIIREAHRRIWLATPYVPEV